MDEWMSDWMDGTTSNFNNCISRCCSNMPTFPSMHGFFKNFVETMTFFVLFASSDE